MKKCSLSLLCLLLLSTSAFAADPPDVTLPDVVSTASRWEEPSKNVTQDITVINRAEIEKKKITFVIDLLRTEPDIQVTQNGGPGTVATVMLRGSGSNQVLVLVDGVKMNNSTTGTTDLSNLLTTDIERIEIIKGAQSTLYGSEAMGGVINIITKKGAGKLKADMTVEGGSYKSFKTVANVSGGTSRVNYRVSANYVDTAGIPIAQDGSIPNGYTNKSVSTRVGVNPTDNSSLEVNFRYENDRSSLDNYGANGPEDTRNYNQNHESYLVSTTGKIFLWEKYQQSLSFSFVDDDLKATDPVTAYNNYYIRTTSQQIDWQHILDLKPLTITGGLSYRYDSANNQGSFSNSFDNRAVYLNAKYMLFNDDLVLNAGGRYDHYSAFGDAFTYRAGLLYNFKPFEMRFKANVGSGFRAPAMNELYYPYYGNANLKPEKSTTYDIGVEKDLFKKKLVLGATWFSQYYRNLIQTNYVTYMAGNIGKARINGVELKATAKVIDNLNLNVSYTWLDAIDRDTGAFLPSRPRSKFTSSVDYTIEKLNLMAEYIYVSKRFDSSLGKNLGGYSLINLNASYELHKNIAIYIRIANLLNKSYSEIAGYGTPGISVYGGVKVNI